MERSDMNDWPQMVYVDFLYGIITKVIQIKLTATIIIIERRTLLTLLNNLIELSVAGIIARG